MEIKYSEIAEKQLKRIVKGDKKSFDEEGKIMFIYDIKQRQEVYND